MPILKYTVVACLHLSTSGDLAFDFTRGHGTQNVISTHVHVFEYKTKHIERQRVLPAFAHAFSCTQLQSTSRPHSFVNTPLCEHQKWPQKTKTTETSTWPTWFRKIESKFIICNIRQSSTKSPALSPAHGHLQQHQRQPGGDLREHRRHVQVAEGDVDDQVHHGPLGQSIRAA
jgi:hypothetical protein